VPFEFLQRDYLYCIASLGFVYLDAFVDLAGEASTELILRVVFVLPHSDLRFLEGQANEFFPCESARDAACSMEGSQIISGVVAHNNNQY
jgi:hypothetical protein